MRTSLMVRKEWSGSLLFLTQRTHCPGKRRIWRRYLQKTDVIKKRHMTNRMCPKNKKKKESTTGWQDLLASSIAPQVMPPWSTMAPSPFASLGIWEDNSRPPGISLESKIKKLHLENIPWNVNVSLVVPTVFLEVQSVVKRVTAQVHNFKS